jgi:putative transposase
MFDCLKAHTVEHDSRKMEKIFHLSRLPRHSLGERRVTQRRVMSSGSRSCSGRRVACASCCSGTRVACVYLRIAADTAASTVKQMIKDRPRRLDLIYFRSPLFFVTFCTRNRTKVSSLDLAQRAIENYARLGILNFDVAMGRYVIMPDHVHLFVRGDHGFVLSTWVGGLKRAISVAVVKQRLWQPGFFDHVLRSSESYAEKWNYVRENPVRAGLVDYAANWPYQGEIVVIDRA